MQIVLDSLVKTYGQLTVVDNISLTIEDGEFFTLLGPSGCGKTTLLRMVAGFNYPNSGDILFENSSIISIPPHRRQTGMVFQNYALFPHLSVFENVAYGLRARKVPKDEVIRKVSDVLKIVQLNGFEDRFPRQLSGGQQQRVALARALVIEPKVLLMDEPLSNLDAKLRVSMREEIRRIQKTLGITTLYVTHDQEEAMAVSDRIAILNKGKIQQVGQPWDIYFSPKNAFTAEFMGNCVLLEFMINSLADFDPLTGLVEGKIAGSSFKIMFDSPPSSISQIIMLRPDWLKIATDADKVNRFTATVKSCTFLGSAMVYHVEAFNQLVRVDIPDPRGHEFILEGQPIDLYFSPERPVVVEK